MFGGHLICDAHVVNVTRVTVGLATKNRPNLLFDCIRSVLAQQLPDDVVLLAVCVVDNSVDGNARAIVTSFIEDAAPPLLYRNVVQGGYATVRNALLDMIPIDSDYFVFIDDDEVADQRWIRELVDHARTKNLQLVGGAIDAVFDVSQVPSWLIERGHADPRIEPALGAVLPTGNLLLEVAAWRRNSLYFDDAFDAVGGEDTDWTLGLLELGLRSGYCGRARVAEAWGVERFVTSYWRRRAFRNGRAYWLRLSKRSRFGGHLGSLLIGVGYRGMPRVFMGTLEIVAAFVTNRPRNVWLGQARCFRGLGIVVQAVASFVGQPTLR